MTAINTALDNVTQDNFTAFLLEVAGVPVETFDALGEGEDLRLQSSNIAGGALAARERLIHLCANVYGEGLEIYGEDQASTHFRGVRSSVAFLLP